MGTRRQARLVHRHVHRPLLALHDERVAKVYAVDLRADDGVARTCAPAMGSVRKADGWGHRSGARTTDHRPDTLRRAESASASAPHPPPPMCGVGAPSPAAGVRSTAPTRRCLWAVS